MRCLVEIEIERTRILYSTHGEMQPESERFSFTPIGPDEGSAAASSPPVKARSKKQVIAEPSWLRHWRANRSTRRRI
jgi:hypothetical protein